MDKIKRILFLTLFLCGLSVLEKVSAQEYINPNSRYPDYVYEYIGEDKYEKFNRRIFNFNSVLNRYAIRPVHILWASIMPKYGMDRIRGVATNIEYPSRLLSSLIQKDFETSKNETIRFITNTTIGLGGMYDPAKSLFNIEPTSENMEQAFSKCKINQGTYIVLPLINGTSPRGILGKGLDAALNPSCYIATPVLAIVKAGLLVNKTSYMQPIYQMIESNYADPYDIARKLYGVENYIKCHNFDRKDVLLNALKEAEDSDSDDLIEKTPKEEPEFVKNDFENELNIEKLSDVELEEKTILAKADKKTKKGLSVSEIVQAGEKADELILNSYNDINSKLMADELIFDYNSQNPVTDSMRTALFDLPGVDESVWAEISLWNRSFANRIKMASVKVTPDRDNYKYRFILQSGRKNSPLAIIFPSIGEGIMSSHSVILAKMFYDEGYSVLILGSAFQWEFAKSMPTEYHPGIPSQDAEYLRILIGKIFEDIQHNYKYEFDKKVIIGTSFGAITALFVADKENRDNTLNISKYISICPPIELIYAMEQVDKITDDWNKNPDNLKERVAMTAAKIIQIFEMNEKERKSIEKLPFSEYEAKLITGFVMHQKLSDLVYTIEQENIKDKKDLYMQINNMSYQNYAEKYLLNDENKTIKDLEYNASLHSISDYLKNSSNYIIFHSINDYLTNSQQLKKLKLYTGAKSVYYDNGSHLGFLYRKEFQQELKKAIDLENLPAKKISERNLDKIPEQKLIMTYHTP